MSNAIVVSNVKVGKEVLSVKFITRKNGTVLCKAKGKAPIVIGQYCNTAKFAFRREGADGEFGFGIAATPQKAFAKAVKKCWLV